MTSSARSTSPSVVIPVDTIIGLPYRAICRNSRWFVTSPDGILNRSTSGARKSADASSKGLERNAIPRSLHRSATI
jgi:hypothetical protein